MACLEQVLKMTVVANVTGAPQLPRLFILALPHGGKGGAVLRVLLLLRAGRQP